MNSFRIVRSNTIEIARDIPADKWDFRATPETRSVLEYFRDILRVTEFVVGMALYPGKISFQERPREQWAAELVRTKGATLHTREEVLEALQRSMEDLQTRVMEADAMFLNETVLFPDGINKVRLWAINTAKEQEMVMRGQLMLIQRMLGIVPHTTRRREEKAKRG